MSAARIGGRRDSQPLLFQRENDAGERRSQEDDNGRKSAESATTAKRDSLMPGRRYNRRYAVYHLNIVR